MMRLAVALLLALCCSPCAAEHLGVRAIDDTLTFTASTIDQATGEPTNADAAPAYRVYEDETGAAILTGTMALLDSTNTAAFYSEQITLSAANGFEAGKSYSVVITVTVGGQAGQTTRNFTVLGGRFITAGTGVGQLNTSGGEVAGIAPGGIGTLSFDAGAITSSVLGTDAIGAQQIASNAITADEIMPGAIGPDQFDAGDEVRDAIMGAVLATFNAAGTVGEMLNLTTSALPDGGDQMAGEDQVQASSFTPVAAKDVIAIRTWRIGLDSATAGNIVTVGRNFAGTLKAAIPLNEQGDIASVSSVTISGAAAPTATNLRRSGDGRSAFFDVPTLSTAGNYTVVITVETVDSQQIPIECRLIVR